jgi:DNA-binding NarL/FixJ family response regulator
MIVGRQATMSKTRLLLVDDHILFREGLSRLLASEPDFEIAGDCGTSAEALEILQHGLVDVVLLDFDIGTDHGAQFISAARHAGYTGKILMVTAGMTAKESSIALKLGASGVFLKHNSPGSLAKAIRLVVSGEMWMDQKVIQLMAEEVQQSVETAVGPLLTDREQQVLQGVFEGLTNKEIAARLGVTEGAIKACLQQLFQKTQVRTRSQLVRMALESSLGTPWKR